MCCFNSLHFNHLKSYYTFSILRGTIKSTFQRMRMYNNNNKIDFGLLKEGNIVLCSQSNSQKVHVWQDQQIFLYLLKMFFCLLKKQKRMQPRHLRTGNLHYIKFFFLGLVGCNYALPLISVKFMQVAFSVSPGLQHRDMERPDWFVDSWMYAVDFLLQLTAGVLLRCLLSLTA